MSSTVHPVINTSQCNRFNYCSSKIKSIVTSYEIHKYIHTSLLTIPPFSTADVHIIIDTLLGHKTDLVLKGETDTHLMGCKFKFKKYSNF